MKKLQILAAALLLHLGCFAQQALFGGQMPLSPEIHADKTVTFRCMAPEAHKVQITGDFLPTKKVDTPMGKYDMPGVDRKRSASQIIFAQKWRLPAGSQNNNTNALHICTAVIS
jgi:enterochelin esterase family protein